MERIGRYRLTQRVGAGSFATVYRGHDDELDVPVAVKVLAENWSDNTDVRQRFLAEARLLRRINDERIVRVYDIGTDNGRPYFVMDFCNAGSLDNLRKQLVAPGRALRLAAEAARALEVLHRHGIIHRDVTPGNVLLTHTPHGIKVQLADLGVAKAMVDQAGATMTAGTPAFMAIEQATGQELDARADVYSMGAVAYSLLTGSPPFPVRTLQDLLARNQDIGPTPIADRIGAPAELDEFFAHVLSPYPSERPPSAVALATMLDRFADVLPGGETYRPRPLEEESGLSTAPRPAIVDSFGPAVPAPDSTSGGQYGSGGSWSSGGSLPDGGNVPIAPAPGFGSGGSYRSLEQPNNVAGRNETPASMLENYLGKGRYQVSKPKERHSLTYYLIIAGTLVVVFLLVVLLTITMAN